MLISLALSSSGEIKFNLLLTAWDDLNGVKKYLHLVKSMWIKTCDQCCLSPSKISFKNAIDVRHQSIIKTRNLLKQKREVELKTIISTTKTKQLKISLVILIAMYILSIFWRLESSRMMAKRRGTKSLERHRWWSS